MGEIEVRKVVGVTLNRTPILYRAIMKSCQGQLDRFLEIF